MNSKAKSICWNSVGCEYRVNHTDFNLFIFANATITKPSKCNGCIYLWCARSLCLATRSTTFCLFFILSHSISLLIFLRFLHCFSSRIIFCSHTCSYPYNSLFFSLSFHSPWIERIKAGIIRAKLFNSWWLCAVFLLHNFSFCWHEIRLKEKAIQFLWQPMRGHEIDIFMLWLF